jgi:preprotein translocase subunit SecB
MAKSKKSDAAGTPAPEAPTTNVLGADAPIPALEDTDGQPVFRVLAQYIRDLSFENPRAPDSLRSDAAAPQMDVGVEMNAKGRPDSLYEVELKIIASAQRDGAAVFHCELLYCGLFQISGLPQQEMEAMLLIECPRFLFPFARQIIADTTSQGGFPPFMLDPIDFQGIYLQQRAQAGQNGGSQPMAPTFGNA